VEGPQNILSAVENGLANYILALDDSEVVEFAQKSRLKVYRINEAASKSLSDTKTPQGIYAVCEMPDLNLMEMQVKRFSIVLDRISDPGNVGTIIRTATAFGADSVIALAGTADVWSGKVVRSTAGAFAQVPIISGVTEEELLTWTAKNGINSLALDGNGSTSMNSLDLQAPHIWLVGNEAGGLTDNLIHSATTSIKIPMMANVESLNAAMAVGICAFASFTAQDK
jgi:TrmH family RNA methyltransferase